MRGSAPKWLSFQSCWYLWRNLLSETACKTNWGKTLTFPRVLHEVLFMSHFSSLFSFLMCFLDLSSPPNEEIIIRYQCEVQEFHFILNSLRKQESDGPNCFTNSLWATVVWFAFYFSLFFCLNFFTFVICSNISRICLL